MTLAAQVPPLVGEAEAEAAANAAYAYLVTIPLEDRGLILGCGDQPINGWLNGPRLTDARPLPYPAAGRAS